MRTLSINELNYVAGGIKAGEIVDKGFYMGAGAGVVIGVLGGSSSDFLASILGCTIIGAMTGVLISLPFAAVAAIVE